jgi:methionine aminopeptidase
MEYLERKKLKKGDIINIDITVIKMVFMVTPLNVYTGKPSVKATRICDVAT